MLEHILSVIQGLNVNDALAIAREVFGAYLAILGGLKVIARVTPWSFDDHVVEVLGKPIDLLKKLLGQDPPAPPPVA